MPRTVAEIEAEIAASEQAGVHPESAKMRSLSAELSAAIDGTSTSADSAVCADASPAPDLYATDEWRFIEKACAEVEIEADGSMTNVVKKVYNVLDAKVKVWRMARDIVAQVGIGNPWPQWSALGRDGSTGERIRDKVARTSVNLPAPAPVAPAAKVTEGGMPVRDRGIEAAMAGSIAGLKEAFRASFKGSGDQQPVPAAPASV